MTGLPIENRTKQIVYVGVDWHSDDSGGTRVFITDEPEIEDTPILPGEAMVLDISTNVRTWTLRRKGERFDL